MSEGLRELDYKIAELLGDRKVARGKWRGYWTAGKGRHYSDQDDGPPHYSTDIAEAWRVVEHMRARGYSFCVYDYIQIESIPVKWQVLFIGGGKSPAASGETFPLAICLAALKGYSMENPYATP